MDHLGSPGVVSGMEKITRFLEQLGLRKLTLLAVTAGIMLFVASILLGRMITQL